MGGKKRKFSEISSTEDTHEGLTLTVLFMPFDASPPKFYKKNSTKGIAS